jgi:hypothetical protein
MESNEQNLDGELVELVPIGPADNDVLTPGFLFAVGSGFQINGGGKPGVAPDRRHRMRFGGGFARQCSPPQKTNSYYERKQVKWAVSQRRIQLH